jgi:hypothetical protein
VGGGEEAVAPAECRQHDTGGGRGGPRPPHSRGSAAARYPDGSDRRAGYRARPPE